MIIVIIVLVLALIYFVLGYFIADSIIHMNRQPVPKNPGNYGMNFENIEFKSSDGVNLKGWLIPGNVKQTYCNDPRRRFD